ncbi:MAG: hypothetical protein QHH15_00225 [Candidatus Thermoplasmatota archaeon]|nr:hypothetical protein [Candidatus Thermoplasmatota archaeon]
MAVEDDIITATDVKYEGAITSSSLNKNINYRIPKSIENVIYDELELVTQDEIQSIIDDRKKCNNLKWAIIYDVLAWLESKNLIKGSDQIVTSVRDSQVSVSYTRGKVGMSGKPTSYEELSKYYINKLRASPPIGGVPLW